MPGTFISAARSPDPQGDPDRGRGVHGEDGEGEPRPDARDGLHRLEDVLLVVVGEAEEGQRVLAHDERGRELGLRADPDGGGGAGGGLHEHADSADLEDGGVEPGLRTVPATEAITAVTLKGGRGRGVKGGGRRGRRPRRGGAAGGGAGRAPARPRPRRAGGDVRRAPVAAAASARRVWVPPRQT